MNTVLDLSDTNILEKPYFYYREKEHLLKNKFYSENPFCLFQSFCISNQKSVQLFLKRFIDLTFSIGGIFITFPLLVFISFAIKLSSKGPVIYKQKRIGKNGKEFYMYKFRTMESDAEKRLKSLKKYNETNELMFKIFDDPRITKIGKFLRKHSLDELPQLFNVIKGEMSLVGFRPPLTNEVANYSKWHFVRFAAMPGITGPWQVNGRSNIKDFEKVINLEYEYINNWSLLKDFKILIKTIPVVLFGENAA